MRCEECGSLGNKLNICNRCYEEHYKGYENMGPLPEIKTTIQPVKFDIVTLCYFVGLFIGILLIVKFAR